MRRLPEGTVTLVFTDVEGSTRLLERLGPDRYVPLLDEHRRLLRETFAGHGGVEVEMQGDSFHFAFAQAREAVAAAAAAQRALAGQEALRVRIGIHTGEPVAHGNLYAGLDVHRAARTMDAAHGGQVVVSEATRAVLGDDLPAGLELTDLGEHRLKDLSGPQRLYQLAGEGLTREFAPLRTLHRTNLPVPPTPFLGRERELAEVCALLGRDDVRLLTLTGPGGTGKTRLAVQAVAEAAERYQDGVFWVGLSAVRDPALVVPTIAQCLGTTADPAQHIGSRRLLLLLDNFEQVVEAAGELAPLLASCPHLDLLVTSREPLHLAAEREYAVQPLDQDDAVALFHERATAVDAEVRANGEIAEICRRLDQLPLAIELAAARVKVLSASALLERLSPRLPLLAGGARDAPERQRTLRSTIDWSYQLLVERERQLFARISVFAGSCTLEAAEDVAGADLDTLHSLVDKSLVRHGADDRYWMLETIREYAAERLAESGEEDELRTRHAAYLVRLADEVEARREGFGEAELLHRLENEVPDVRQAVDWLLVNDPHQALRLAVATTWYWSIRHHPDEPRRWIETSLSPSAPPDLRVKALRALSHFAFRVSDLEHARRYAEERLSLELALGSPPATLAGAYTSLANIAQEQGDAEGLAEFEAKALEESRASGDARAIAGTRLSQAERAVEDGRPEDGVRLFEEAAILYTELGDDLLAAAATGGVGIAAAHLGDWKTADDRLRKGLRVHQEVGYPMQVAIGLDHLAAVAAGRGDPQRAARLLGAAETAWGRLGVPYGEGWHPTYAATMARLGEHLSEEEIERARDAGRREDPDRAVEYALSRD